MTAWLIWTLQNTPLEADTCTLMIDGCVFVYTEYKPVCEHVPSLVLEGARGETRK